MTRPHPSLGERALRARIAANTRWAHTDDRGAATAPAREALDRRFEDEVDPGRVLSPADRAVRVVNARRAYFSRLALRSAVARRTARALVAEADAADEQLTNAGHK